MGHPNRIMTAAQVFCREHKERLTAPRWEVLKIVAMSSKPLKAYEILEKLGQVISSPKPPTVYRAIDFWQQKNFIHHIKSLNAYIVCRIHKQCRKGHFMICNDCGIVIESYIDTFLEPLKQDSAHYTFSPLSWHIEVYGVCQQCQHK